MRTIRNSNPSSWQCPEHKVVVAFGPKPLSPALLTLIFRLERKEALVGAEPTVADSQSPTEIAQTISLKIVGLNQEIRMALCVALLDQCDVNLAKLIKAWPTLPDAIRRAISAMIDASSD